MTPPASLETSFSSIFRGQSGFHYSAAFANTAPDVDGDNHFNAGFTKTRQSLYGPVVRELECIR